MKSTISSSPVGYIKFIAYLQVIGIILVVAGHSLHEYPDGAHGWSTPFYRAFMTFRMPLFMFVSGLLMVYTTKVATCPKYSPKEFAVNKLRRLILPFIVLTLVTFFPRAMAGGVADDELPMTVGNFMLAFIRQENMPIPFLWFLQASFIMLTLTYTLQCLVGPKSVKWVTAVLAVAFLALLLAPVKLPSHFAFDKIQSLGFYFVLGCVYGLFFSNVDRFVPWTKPWMFLTLSAVWFVLFKLLESSSFYFLCSLAGIAMCISLAKILEERQWRFLDHLMGANYLIFLLSWYFNIASQQVLAHFVTLPWWVHTALSLISGIYVPWLGYKYLEAHQQSRWVRVTSFLLGQSFKSKK